MVITSKDIREILKDIWPDLDHIWLTDSKYTSIESGLLSVILSNSKLPETIFINDLWDCDNYALQLHAQVQKFQYESFLRNKTTGSAYSWAFGECLGTSFNNKQEVHAVNIAITNSGIRLIEPQNNKIWIPERGRDEIFFVKF